MKKMFKGIKYEKYYKDLLPYFKKEKNQRYFTIILTLGASIFFTLFAINPTLSTISKLRKELEDSKFVEQKLSQKINNLSSLSTGYQSIQKDIALIHDAIPLQPEAPLLVAQIQSIAQDSGVSVTELKVLPINLNSQSATVSSAFGFQLTVEANYEGLQTFTSNLTNMQRVVSIDGISITKTEDGDQNLEIDINGSAFYKK